jgi:hypothetical protein
MGAHGSGLCPLCFASGVLRLPFAALRGLCTGQRIPSADASGQANPLALERSVSEAEPPSGG